jgi:hypothetical protein
VLTATGGVLTCTSPQGALYVGSSAVSVNGQITHTPLPSGLSSAAAYCADTYGAEAHMCTVQEIYASAVAGKFTVGTPIGQSWIYFPAWQQPAGTPSTNPSQGLADNCAGYTYPTAHLGWRGVAFEWNQNGSGTWSPFYDTAACFTSLPIACCK